MKDSSHQNIRFEKSLRSHYHLITRVKSYVRSKHVKNYEGGLFWGFIGGAGLSFIFFTPRVNEIVYQFAAFFSGASLLTSNLIVLRPLFKRKSLSTFWEGLVTGVSGFFRVFSLIIFFTHGKWPYPY